VKMFDAGKNKMIRLPYGEKKTMTICEAFSYNTSVSRTDRRTDRQNCYYQYRAIKMLRLSYYCCEIVVCVSGSIGDSKTSLASLSLSLHSFPIVELKRDYCFR